MSVSFETKPAPANAWRFPPARKFVPHLVPWVLIVSAFFLFEGYLGMGTQILIMIIFALSLDLIVGYAGIVTLGHAVFFGVGGYAAGLIALHLTPDPLLGLACATVITALFGAIVGLCILHTHGLTLVVLTLAIAAVVGEVANQFSGLTGGDNGLTGYSIEPIFGVYEFDLWSRTAYAYSAAVLLVWFIFSAGMVNSPFGKSIEGIRQSPSRMRAIGAPVWRRKVVVFALSAAMAGSAGALAAQTVGVVGLDSFSLILSGSVLVILVFGGTGKLYGAFIGATVYALIHEFSSQYDPFYWMFVVGALLVVTVLFLENGLIGLIDGAKRVSSQFGMHFR